MPVFSPVLVIEEGEKIKYGTDFYFIDLYLRHWWCAVPLGFSKCNL